MATRFIGRFALAWVFITSVGAAAANADDMRSPPRPDPALPPIEAVLLPAPSQGAAEALARRLGFASLLAAGNAWTVTARLGNAAVVWYDPATYLRFGLARPTDVAPVVGHRAPEHPPVLPVAFWEDVPAAQMPHPNGASLLVGIIAVTAHLDRTCKRWWKRQDGGPSPFGRTEAEPRLGARSRSCFVEGPQGARVRVRVIEPTDPNGLAARLLSKGGSRWVGVMIGVGDVTVAARRLEHAGVRATLGPPGTAAGTVLIVDPRDAGGALIEFVPDPASVVRPGVVR